MKTKAGLTMSEIGRRFNRDHTTVVYAIKTIQDLLSYNDNVRKQVLFLESQLN